MRANVFCFPGAGQGGTLRNPIVLNNGQPIPASEKRSTTTAQPQKEDSMHFVDFVNAKIGDPNKKYELGETIGLEELAMVYSLYYGDAPSILLDELPQTIIMERAYELSPALKKQYREYDRKTTLAKAEACAHCGPLLFNENLRSDVLYADPRDPEARATVIPHFTSDGDLRSDYYVFADGAQPIDLARSLPFLNGNVVKYMPRVGRKSLSISDLLKAEDYAQEALAIGSGSTDYSYHVSEEHREIFLKILPSMRSSAHRLAMFYSYKGWNYLALQKIREAISQEIKLGSLI